MINLYFLIHSQNSTIASGIIIYINRKELTCFSPQHYHTAIAMTMSTIWLLTLFSVIYGSAATHHIYRNLQSVSSDSSNQPYRTAYHFQPPKNWINGIYISFFLQLVLYFLMYPLFLSFFLFFSFFLSNILCL